MRLATIFPRARGNPSNFQPDIPHPILLRVVLLFVGTCQKPASPAVVRGVYRDEYCRGRLLFPLTNHPPMSRGGRAAMFYSPPVDRVDIRTPLLGLFSSPATLVSSRSRFGITLTNSKTYRCHFVKGFPALCDRCDCYTKFFGNICTSRDVIRKMTNDVVFCEMLRLSDTCLM